LALALPAAPAAGATGAGAPKPSANAAGSVAARIVASPLTAGALAPTVTLNPLPLVSADTTPAFSGTASDVTPVTVSVYQGTGAEGTPLATLKANVSAGSWVSGYVSPPLPSGQHTAVASQESSLGGEVGVSSPVRFEVNSESPVVTLEPVPTPSKDTAPSFSGTASGAKNVTVEVFEGTRPEGQLVAIATARGTGGAWSSGQASPPLASGKHVFTALAIQPSAVRNAAGKSAPVMFEVDTLPPTVTLLQPPSPANDATPSFSGTASEPTEVTVKVFAGTASEGQPVAEATASGTGGSWTSSQAEPALGDGTFTAIATQSSAIGNPPGRSAAVTFIVDTATPTVTLNAPLSPSPNRAPSFSGTASDHTPITVDVYEGTAAEGMPVASATAEADLGKWISAKASPALQWGVYTAVARQPSSLGNPSGSSAPVTFAVQPITPIVATEAASQVTRTSAALYASVNPRGGGVAACDFEYGPTTFYGKSVECGFVSELPAFPPSATTAVPVFARIYGLTPGATYHFRIAAVGEGGASAGSDETFATLPPRPGQGESSAQGGSGARGVAAGALAELIAAQLTPHGRGARIGALLRSGVFRGQFRAPEPGSAVLGWYYLPAGAKRARAGTHSPVLIVAGGLQLRSAGSAALTLRLTSAGRRVLAGAQRIKVSARCLFTPVSASPVRASARFELRQ
jgi:hypothetical protein